jgi:hypothetical protein
MMNCSLLRSLLPPTALLAFPPAPGILAGGVAPGPVQSKGGALAWLAGCGAQWGPQAVTTFGSGGPDGGLGAPPTIQTIQTTGSEAVGPAGGPY